MKEALVDWYFAEAQWWQFWMPQSGLAGGVIASFVVWIIAGVALLVLS